MSKPRKLPLTKDGTKGMKWYRLACGVNALLSLVGLVALISMLILCGGVAPVVLAVISGFAGAGWIGIGIGTAIGKGLEWKDDREWSEFVKGLSENAGSYKQSVEIWTQCDQEIEKLSDLIERVRQVKGDDTQLPDALKKEVLSALQLDKTPAVPSLSKARALYELGKQLEATLRTESFHRERLDIGFEYWKKYNQYVTSLSETDYKRVMEKDGVDYSQSAPPEGYSGGWTNPYKEPEDDFPGPPCPQVVPPPDKGGIPVAVDNLTSVVAPAVAASTIANNTNTNKNKNS